MIAYRQLLALVAALLLSISWAPKGYGGAQGESITHADAVGVVCARRADARSSVIESDDETTPEVPAVAARLSGHPLDMAVVASSVVLRLHARAEPHAGQQRRPLARGPPRLTV